MGRRKKQSPADLALGKPEADAPITRTVAKSRSDVWPEILDTIILQSRALLHKHLAKIKRAHKDAKDVESPQGNYRISLTAVINDDHPDQFDVDTKIAYASGMKESFAAKTRDSAKALVAATPDMVDQMEDGGEE